MAANLSFSVVFLRRPCRCTMFQTAPGVCLRERTLGSLISCKLGCKFWCQPVPKNRAQYEPVAWWFTQRRIGRALRDCYPVSEDLPARLLTLVRELGGHPAPPAGDNSAARCPISEDEGPRSELSGAGT